MLRYSANENAIRNALSQSLSFPAPLDKGNEGSGNEIGFAAQMAHAPLGCAALSNVADGLADVDWLIKAITVLNRCSKVFKVILAQEISTQIYTSNFLPITLPIAIITSVLKILGYFKSSPPQQLQTITTLSGITLIEVNKCLYTCIYVVAVLYIIISANNEKGKLGA